MRMGELPRRWDADLTEALAALDPAASPGLGGHPLLLMPGDRYRWYSEDTYRFGEPAALAAAADFAARGGQRWAARLRRGTADWLRYVHAAYVLWRTFRLAEAKPFLELIAAVEPERADTHFYLGQLCQDALGRMADAVGWSSRRLTAELEAYQKYVDRSHRFRSA